MTAIYVWRFLSNIDNYPGWNVAVDASGASAWLAEIDRIMADRRTVAKELGVTAPTPTVLECVNNQGAAVASPTRIWFEWSADPSHISVQESHGGAIIRAGDISLKRLSDALTHPDDWFDRSLAPDSGNEGEIWFWGIFGACTS